MRRARPRSSRILLLLSAALAVLATLALRGHLARLEARAAAAGPAAAVVVATSDLDRGTMLDPSMLDVRTVPDRYRPPGALAEPRQAAGRILAADVAEGETLTAARLASPGGPVAALVPEGLRAFPVTAALPRGTLAPGDRVDVLATFAAGQPYTETVTSEAEVLLVLDADGPEDLGQGATVVLLVGPEVAERLAYARAFADISLAVAPPESMP
ncbi:MAG: Flp pilus assembly protein CpaB [Actinomycetota bacterium]